MYTFFKDSTTNTAIQSSQDGLFCIQTSRLYIKPANLGEMNNYKELFQDPVASDGFHTHADDPSIFTKFMNMIEGGIKQASSLPNYLGSIYERTTNKFIGFVWFTTADKDSHKAFPELPNLFDLIYGLLPIARGKGYIQEAVQAILNHHIPLLAAYDYPVDAVIATVVKTNVASKNVLKNIAFHKTDKKVPTTDKAEHTDNLRAWKYVPQTDTETFRKIVDTCGMFRRDKLNSRPQTTAVMSSSSSAPQP